MKLIVGLGNPGRAYARHRHNIGFVVADELARRHGIRVAKRAFDAVMGKGVMDDIDVIVAKPTTYMNRAGYAVGPLIDYYRLAPDDLIVVHDDIDLALGAIKVAQGAGHGGHNGVRSIMDELDCKDFFRIRVGVGRPPLHMDPADYVLQPFSDDERESIDAMVLRAADAVESLLKLSLKEVQNRYH